MKECDNQSTARSPNRMSQSNAVSINIHFIAIQTQFLFAGKILGGKGLVDFESINVTQFKFGLFQSALDGWDRANTHVIRINPGHVVFFDLCKGFKSQFFGLFPFNDHDC